MHIKNLYVHVPFCKSRCDYCGFYSTTSNDLQEAWLQAVCRHLDSCKEQYAVSCLDTLYIGGGSPSCLKPHIFETLCSKLSALVSDNTEWTVEINPADSNTDLWRNINNFPVNRVSVGIETFNDELRASIHRRGTKADVLAVLDYCTSLVNANLSFDLMYGFPEQDREMVQEDMRLALQYNPAHISYYELILEPGTPLDSRLANRILTSKDIEEKDSCWELIRSTLEAADYKRYEVSNWARSGLESRHNMNYWRLGSWLALGPGAVSNIRDQNGFKRWTNTMDLHAYIEDYTKCQMELVKEDEALLDYVMMNLRKKIGIERLDFLSIFPAAAPTILEFFQNTFPRYFLLDNEYLRINDSGLDRLNYIIIKFMQYMEKTAHA